MVLSFIAPTVEDTLLKKSYIKMVVSIGPEIPSEMGNPGYLHRRSRVSPLIIGMN